MAHISTDFQPAKNQKRKAILRGSDEIQDAATRRRKLFLAPLLAPGVHVDHIIRHDMHNRTNHIDPCHVYDTRHPIYLS